MKKGILTGTPQIGIAITPQPGVNYIEIADDVGIDARDPVAPAAEIALQARDPGRRDLRIPEGKKNQ